MNHKFSTSEVQIFWILDAMELAKSYDNYNKKSGAVRVDTREPEQMNWLSRYEFGIGLKELEKAGFVEIESFATDKNENEQRHFQIKPLKGSCALYSKLSQKSFPLNFNSIPNKEIICGKLKFKPTDGKKFGKIKYKGTVGRLTIGCEPWSILFCLLQNKNKSMTTEQLKSAVINGWRIKKNKKMGTTEEKIHIPEIVKRIRRILKMGAIENPKNKNIIEPDGNGGYRIICK